MKGKTMTREAIEAALKDNAEYMHDAWLDAYNLLRHVATNIRAGGIVYLSPTNQGLIDKALEAGATAMSRNDKLEDELAALQNEDD